MPSDSNTGASTSHEHDANGRRSGRSSDRDRGGRGGWRPRRCRFCGRRGHLIANCYLYRGIEILGARRVAIEWRQRLQRRHYRHRQQYQGQGQHYQDHRRQDHHNQQHQHQQHQHQQHQHQQHQHQQHQAQQHQAQQQAQEHSELQEQQEQQQEQKGQ
ncbi:hypothetical protein ASPFODRAFT_210038 [Aspergillus luchuensis CBS 106.47]|uniref:CCHC-type domain-containing protein n=1 Tax=Aspergillus luchuensis (strain CBS 106.47) TaxID=1137211 RepID=A0A1M3T8X7_ASPLC|nr:hypothetical protein ASPFODRAFT_210038 [Aspergillus luchuensis CBS 106.47]